MKTIFVMVKCELGKAYDTADAAVADIEQVSEVYSTSGQYDLLMKCYLPDSADIGRFVTERVQTLGAIAVGDPRHVAEITRIPRPPDGAEEVPAMLSRLLEAHEHIIKDARELAQRADELGDLVTNDILVSDVLRTNELQVWFIAEHLVDRPLVVV